MIYGVMACPCCCSTNACNPMNVVKQFVVRLLRLVRIFHFYYLKCTSFRFYSERREHLTENGQRIRNVSVPFQLHSTNDELWKNTHTQK